MYVRWTNRAVAVVSYSQQNWAGNYRPEVLELQKRLVQKITDVDQKLPLLKLRCRAAVHSAKPSYKSPTG